MHTDAQETEVVSEWADRKSRSLIRVRALWRRMLLKHRLRRALQSIGILLLVLTAGLALKLGQ